ncbi:MAG TPA: lytic transglycosylase domain-containing protein [Actinomycetes bacterium]|nr:lytic transglycosylase domain-containing protein [Actinomycetes bacterium]
MTSTARSTDRWPVGLPRFAVAWIIVSLTLAMAASAIWADRGWAESADEAQQRAEAAAEQVAALQDQVDAAQARYEAAMNGLASSVTHSIAADQAAADAAEQAREDELHRIQAVRALNQSGGSLGIIDTVLSAETPGDMVARWQMGQNVMQVLSERSQAASAATIEADKQSQLWEANADREIASVDDVQAAYTSLVLLLDQQQQILDGLDARARHLAAAERAAARLAAQQAAAASAASSASATASGIPKNFLTLYRNAAATCSGMPWPVLAAVGQVESGHGTNNGPSSSGAEGPMQFLPSTFAAYAVDGDGDGDRDIWDPADSIYTAAHYLCANGAGQGPRGLYAALWQYNHADWYVLLVMNVAGQIAQRFNEPVPVATAPS